MRNNAQWRRTESHRELAASYDEPDGYLSVSGDTPREEDREPRRPWLLGLIVVLCVIIMALAVGLAISLTAAGGSGGSSSSSSSSSEEEEKFATPVPTDVAATSAPVPTAARRPTVAPGSPTVRPTTQPPVTFRPTATPGSPTFRPTAAGQTSSFAFCCYYSPSGDLCGDCSDPTTSGFCSESASNCEGACSGTFCSNPAPTTLPAPRPTGPTGAPSSSPPSSELAPITQRNVFAEAGGVFYVNPTYAANLDRTIANTRNADVAATLEAMKEVPSAYWIDVKSKISGNSTSDLRGILIDALRQDPVPLCVFIVYDLPNRDCHAYASRGEICCAYFSDGTCDYDNSGDCAAGLDEYKTSYIDPFVDVLVQFDGIVPVALVIEPDSLPNFATNADDPRCGNEGTQNAYTEGIAYAVTQVATRTTHVATYLDAAHGGWLGWESNLDSFVATVADMGISDYIRGFATNVANYQDLGIPCDGDDEDSCLTGDSTRACCDDPCGLLAEYNGAQNEYNYAKMLVSAFEAAIPGFDPHVIIDTGRNGNPAGRTDCSTWCNPRDMLVGEWPTADTLDPDNVDALYWLKTPGESDGCTELLPSEDNEFVAAGECPRYDQSCAAVDSIGTADGEPYCPEAGVWFEYQIKMLAGAAFTATTSPTIAVSPRPTHSPAPTIETLVSRHGALVVSGNRVVDSNGDAIQLVGVSFFWSNSGWEGAKFYTSGAVDALVDDWDSDIVRAALGVEDSTGYVDDPDANLARVRVVVEAAVARGIYVIIDWHSHNAEKYVDQAKIFFETVATDYGAYANVVFEVYNEPIDQPWSTLTDDSATASETIKGYAEEIIPIIRAHSSNLIVVGTRSYSQQVWEAALDPITAYDNIAYTSHFYAGTHGAWERSLVRKALLGADYVAAAGEEAEWADDQNPTPVAVFVTEWGTVSADGGGTVDEDSTRDWLAFCDEYGISHCNWSACDKDEGSAILVPGADVNGAWSTDDYTTSGAFVRSLLLDYAAAAASTS
ncbi:hypothetical protein CTAYLR_010496 [Chrysophaeum taylorii]|uniref:Glycoside hydrolase family 5 domain-containing protein n=1 Tax=Chrysophaeum taylorii TaxID=2483200 RepID=A0AAD7UH76_9STRA|nr:hypothetical protein CTAYLR_010496 [Chrysophaeum taylorii]